MTPRAAAPCLLIVEADAELREILHLVLGEEGYQVTGAASLAQALALLHQETFDCVLTDVFHSAGQPPLQSVLPLLKRAAPTPVGILTAWNCSEQAAQQEGFACFIKQPFDLEAFMATIAAVLNKPLTPE